MNLRPNRLHLSFLLLIPLFFVLMNGANTLDIYGRIPLFIISSIGAALWIWFMTRDTKDEVELKRY